MIDCGVMSRARMVRAVAGVSILAATAITTAVGLSSESTAVSATSTRPAASTAWLRASALAAAPNGDLWFGGRSSVAVLRNGAGVERWALPAPTTYVADVAFADGEVFASAHDGLGNWSLLRLADGSLRSVAVDGWRRIDKIAPAGDGLWLGELEAKDGPRRLDTRLFWLPHGGRLGTRRHALSAMAGDPDGSVWIARGRRVEHLSSDGTLGSYDISGRRTLSHLAADGVGGVWAATASRVVHVSAAGRRDAVWRSRRRESIATIAG